MRTTTEPKPSPVGPGDYLCSERELFRVEKVADDRVLIEDCRTNTVFDMELSELAALDRVDRS